MSRLLALLSLVVVFCSASGCAMCNKCGDDCYGFYGGVAPRHDFCHGRVGSAFEPAGGSTGEEEVGEYSDEEGYETDESAAEESDVEVLPLPRSAIKEEFSAEEDEFTTSSQLSDEPTDLDQPPRTQPTRNSRPRVSQQDYLK